MELEQQVTNYLLIVSDDADQGRQPGFLPSVSPEWETELLVFKVNSRGTSCQSGYEKLTLYQLLGLILTPSFLKEPMVDSLI